MWKLLGFILFWVGVGIIISLCIQNPLIKLLVAIILMIVGYNAFCKC